MKEYGEGGVGAAEEVGVEAAAEMLLLHVVVWVWCIVLYVLGEACSGLEQVSVEAVAWRGSRRLHRHLFGCCRVSVDTGALHDSCRHLRSSGSHVGAVLTEVLPCCPFKINISKYNTASRSLRCRSCFLRQQQPHY